MGLQSIAIRNENAGLGSQNQITMIIAVLWWTAIVYWNTNVDRNTYLTYSRGLKFECRFFYDSTKDWRSVDPFDCKNVNYTLRSASVCPRIHLSSLHDPTKIIVSMAWRFVPVFHETGILMDVPFFRVAVAQFWRWNSSKRKWNIQMKWYGITSMKLITNFWKIIISEITFFVYHFDIFWSYLWHLAIWHTRLSLQRKS